MLAEMTPGQLVEWKAAYETVPLDDGWRQADTIAGAFHDEMEYDRQCAAGKQRIDNDRMHKVGSYIPRVRLKKPPVIKVNHRSIDLTQSLIASHYGQ